jgi:hypothetical protein
MNKDFFVSIYDSLSSSVLNTHLSSSANTNYYVSTHSINSDRAHKSSKIMEPHDIATMIGEVCQRLNQLSNSCKFENLSLFLAMAQEEARIVQGQHHP